MGRTVWLSTSGRRAFPLLLSALCACATQAPTDVDRVTVWLSESPRVLSLEVDKYLPEPEVRTRDYKVGKRVGSGLSTGGKAAPFTLGPLCRGGARGSRGDEWAALPCALGVMLSPFVFLGGSVVGAASVDSEDTLLAVETAPGAPELFEQARTLDLPHLLSDGVIGKATEARRHTLVSVPDDSPAVEGTLSLRFDYLELFGTLSEDPSVALLVRVDAGLRSPDAEVGDWGEFKYESRARPLSEWGADGARAFKEELKAAFSSIADRVVDKLAEEPPAGAASRVAAERERERLAALQPPAPRAEPPAAYLESPDALPAVGTVWTYRFQDRQFGRRQADFRVHLDRVDQSFVGETLSGDQASSRTIDIRDTVFLEHSVVAGAELIEFAPYLLAGRRATGSSTGFTAGGYPARGDSSASWLIRVEPPTWDSISVAAGTFRALHVHIEGHRARPIQTQQPIAARFLVHAWYAPEVGRVVKLEHKTWGGSSNPISDDLIELVEFRPPS
jgi:hypothetical protein